MSMYQDLAASHHIPLLPFLLENVALKPELMQADGLHPNAQGQPLLLDNVWPKLEPLLKSAAHELKVQKRGLIDSSASSCMRGRAHRLRRDACSRQRALGV